MNGRTGLFLAVAVAAASLCGATPPPKAAPSPTPGPASNAPGDEYFGRQKLSYLGINNIFRDEAIRIGEHTTDLGEINKLDAAADALHAWSSKYPHDQQLPRSYFLGQLAFRRVWTLDGQEIAWSYMQILVTRFPSTFFGKAMKSSLARGFTMNYYAAPLPCPTPTPLPPTPLPKGVRPPPPTATPPPTPSPTPTPEPTPRNPKEPTRNIMEAPCVPPPTPEPTPTPTPLATATPKATQTPRATATPVATATPEDATPAATATLAATAAPTATPK